MYMVMLNKILQRNSYLYILHIKILTEAVCISHEKFITASKNLHSHHCIFLARSVLMLIPC